MPSYSGLPVGGTGAPTQRLLDLRGTKHFAQNLAAQRQRAASGLSFDGNDDHLELPFAGVPGR